MMHRSGFGMVAGLLLCGTLGMGDAWADGERTYSNPILDQRMADPDVLLHEGAYYLYATEPGHQYRVYTSTDLVNWEEGPVVFEPGREHVWAPDVYHHPEDERVYLYYTVSEEVGVAVADSPMGPFEDQGVLAERSIDGHMFRDEDGSLYLYYNTIDPFGIWVQPMSDPLTPEGERELLLEPTEEWEQHEHPVTEAAYVVLHEGTYYLMYSGSHAASPYYAIGYATSDSPTGPFEKYEGNPIVQRSEGVYGTGHHTVAEDGAGELWIVYHQKRNDDWSFNRFLAIDPLWIDEDGVMHGRATRGTEHTAPVPLGEE